MEEAAAAPWVSGPSAALCSPCRRPSAPGGRRPLASGGREEAAGATFPSAASLAAPGRRLGALPSRPGSPGATAAAARPLRRKVSAAAAAPPPPAPSPGSSRTAPAEPGLRSALGERSTPQGLPRGAQSEELCKAPPGRFPSYCLHNGDKLG